MPYGSLIFNKFTEIPLSPVPKKFEPFSVTMVPDDPNVGLIEFMIGASICGLDNDIVVPEIGYAAIIGMLAAAPVREIENCPLVFVGKSPLIDIEVTVFGPTVNKPSSELLNVMVCDDGDTTEFSEIPSIDAPFPV